MHIHVTHITRNNRWRQANDSNLAGQTTDPNAHNFRFNGFRPNGSSDPWVKPEYLHRAAWSSPPIGADFQKCSPKTPAGDEPADVSVCGALPKLW